MALVPLPVFSGGFSIPEQNVSGMGNAYAGAVAIAEDASTIYYNPAGLTKIPGRQIVLAGTLISLGNTLNNAGSLPAFRSAQPISFQPIGNNVDSKETPIVGNAYLASALSGRWRWGMGIGSEFGLGSNYGSTWFGRYIVTKAEMQTITLNPAISLALTDTLSIGAGINYLFAKAKLNNATNFGILGDGPTKVDVKDNAWGANVGVLWSPNRDTQVGISYRSSYRLKMTGTIASSFPGTVDQLQTLPLPQQIALRAANGPVDVELKLPDTASIGFVHALSDRVQLLADVTWTGWHAFKTLKVVAASTGDPLSTIPQHWKDAFRVALGTNIQVAPGWKLKFGAGYDQSPVPEAYRGPIIPDSNKLVLAIGVQHAFTENVVIDAGYIHAFAKKVSVNDSPRDATGNPLQGAGRLIGEGKQNVDVFGVQVRYSF